ncbi:phosphate ABC transporter permease subunit PstC [Mangrovactinospora gilvigrisea]|uniref:Phosphate transport system permease protein n=1 Tax=Mangrovactinospora gilvigrisea TaxID=1428644 RepID=A0A1J7CB88_9ACTN|nr:phosphate ABC transporter permease subunit PstC [Mangrovactinospora gilvigrisea]
MRGRGGGRAGDRVFLGLSRGAGILLLIVIAAIAGFLLYRGINAIKVDQGNFLTTAGWDPNGLKPVFGVAALVVGTVLSSIVAMVIAVPVGVGVALFISHYAPRRLAQLLGWVVDLLAAVPSVVYGLWGTLFLVPKMMGIHTWLGSYLGWVPVFNQSQPGAYPRTLFTAGVVLAIMVLPIITAMSREVFLQTPRAHEEAALALGATRWEMIRTAVLPFGRPGVISGSMLALGRALGETMAVAMVISQGFNVTLHLLDPGTSTTIAANIANGFGEASRPVGVDALIASGLVLFVITLIVNGIARWIVARRKEFAGSAA